MTGQARCAKCQQPLEADARFCAKCGAPVQSEAVDLRNAPRSTPEVSECPSCHHENPNTARFCERCGTQLRGIGPGGSALEPPGARASHSGASEPADPWATGPGYERQVSSEAPCPRCSTFRNPGDTSCVECGLPFGAALRATGVPETVAKLGDPAGFWIRVAAALVDGLIIFGIGAVIWPILFGEAFWYTDTIEFDDGTTTDVPAVRNWITLMQILYDTFFIGAWGATPGKRLFNIQVYDARGRRGIGFLMAAVRALGTIVSTFTLFIGYIMVAFRRDKRALHDLIAGTYPTIRRK